MKNRNRSITDLAVHADRLLIQSTEADADLCNFFLGELSESIHSGLGCVIESSLIKKIAADAYPKSWTERVPQPTVLDGVFIYSSKLSFDQLTPLNAKDPSIYIDLLCAAAGQAPNTRFDSVLLRTELSRILTGESLGEMFHSAGIRLAQSRSDGY